MTHAAMTHESSLLLTLEEISQLVSHSHDSGETLANIVRLIQRRFHTDVCSVYLLEPQRGELLLGATVGLQPESVGRVRMRLDEGLTGLVAERLAPVMVEDAFAHPRFKYFAETGEDPYHSFLGVPLVEGGALQGVLVVQTVEPRTFSPNEVRMLVTVASQLAPLVSEACLLERIVALAHGGTERALPGPEPEGPSSLRGTSLSPGTGGGEVYLGNGFDDWQRSVPMRGTDPAAEQRRLATAMKAARAELTRVSQHVSALVGEDHGAILQTQLLMMQDRAIEQDLTDCLTAGSTAEGALIQTLDKYVAAFQRLSTPFFQERVYDVKDVFRRILWHLRPHPAATGTAGGRLVLVAQEASVMDLFAVDPARLAAVVVEHGGPQSHAAILARSLGVPMVGQVPELASCMRPGRQLLVDGSAGVVHLDPAPQLLAVPRPPAAEGVASYSEAPASDLAFADRPRIEVNINLLCEVAPALRQRAGGVGLYRTELLFLARRTLPTEEEQLDIYRKLLALLAGRPASIRTFDLRPDKLARSAHLTSAAGPLDWRRVLDSPPVQQLFKDQVRAILRAAVAGPARILIPSVARTEQLDFILQTVAQARAELRAEGLEHHDQVPLGIMIEVAAATALVDAWARHVQFFALGTNDLVASALGIDRDDAVSAGSNDPLHPGLLRMIRDVVAAAHRTDRRVTVCGEMAADPEGALALAAFEVDALSVAVGQLAATRTALANPSLATLPELAPQLLRLRTAEQARHLLRQWSKTHGCKTQLA
jgi:phosphotransferase system enzyme I (PtsP)